MIDRKCRALAEAFLADQPLPTRSSSDDREHQQQVRALAQRIQDAIEQWFFEHVFPDEVKRMRTRLAEER